VPPVPPTTVVASSPPHCAAGSERRYPMHGTATPWSWEARTRARACTPEPSAKHRALALIDRPTAVPPRRRRATPLEDQDIAGTHTHKPNTDPCQALLPAVLLGHAATAAVIAPRLR
jgi:hypothetical protein